MVAQMNSTYGLFRYIEPDPNERAEDRAFFTTPTALVCKDEKLPLRDFRFDREIMQGPQGLDIQGFTYVKHKSALTSEDMLSGTNVEDTYIQETADLILKITGGRRAFVQSVTFRRKPTAGADASNIEGTSRVTNKCHDYAPILQKQAFSSAKGVRITGRETAEAWDPSRRVHCDFTKKGMLDTMRLSGQDLANAAKPVLSQLSCKDQHEAEESSTNGPRLAAYSVWRPLCTVKRDPIACLDWRTTDRAELTTMGLRVPSEMNEEKEYVLEQWAATPPKTPEKHRWYWIPNQEPDDVAIIKFADTAESDTIAAGCIHGSPWVLGAEKEAPRESVEARVYVFWD